MNISELKQVWSKEAYNMYMSFIKECERVCEALATFDDAFDSKYKKEFELIPEKDMVIVVIHIEKNVTYTRYLPSLLLTLSDEELPKTIRGFIDFRDNYIKEQENK